MSPIQELVNKICEKLPEEWQIAIELEHDSCQVLLNNPDGDKVFYPSNHECIEDSLNDALDHAIHHAGDYEE